MATGYTYGIRNALQSKGVTGNRIGFNSKSGSVTIDGKDFIKPGTVSNGTANTTQAGFNTAWGSFNSGAQNATVKAAQNASKMAMGNLATPSGAIKTAYTTAVNNLNNPNATPPAPTYNQAYVLSPLNCRMEIGGARPPTSWYCGCEY